MKIPYLSLRDVTQQHEEEILRAVGRVVKSGWYLQGEETAAFEREFAAYTGMSHCVGCGNGLDALMLIFQGYLSMGLLEKGDEVIVPANTYIASILAITECGLTPILVEPRLETFLIDDREIDSNITKKTKAILLVHLYGYNAFTERIGKICSERNLLLIEDCAQSHGNVVPHKPLRGACAYSFYPGKNLGALGDGGCVTTDDDVLAERVRAFGNYGSSRKYVFDYRGRNSRLDEIQAAVIRVKMKYIDHDNRRRREIASRYISGIHHEGIRLPSPKGVFHIFPLLCTRRDEVQRYLAECGVGTMIHYPIPPHLQKAYSEWNTISLPVTERIHREELSLPCNQTMSNEEADYVVACINSM